MRSLGLGTLILCFALMVLQLWVYVPQLPDRVASHFGAAGQANGWLPKEVFVCAYVGILFVNTLVMVGFGKLVAMTPESLINIPHREYWLHPDRREATLVYTQNFLTWVAGLTALFLIGVFQLVIWANLPGRPKSDLDVPSFGVLLGVYLVTLTVTMIFMYRRFSRPATSSS